MLAIDNVRYLFLSLILLRRPTAFLAMIRTDNFSSYLEFCRNSIDIDDDCTTG